MSGSFVTSSSSESSYDDEDDECRITKDNRGTGGSVVAAEDLIGSAVEALTDAGISAGSLSPEELVELGQAIILSMDSSV